MTPDSREAVALDGLARRAADGDRDALSELVRQLQHPMYRLALRFLGDPEDAADACQEILVRIVTRLGSFQGRSKFTTWAYTVATRSLLRTRKRLIESSVRGAERFAAMLDAGLGEVDTTMEEAEYRLLCLSRPQRAAYLLANVVGLSDVEGAARARRTLRQVIDGRCSLVDPANPCRCGRQIGASQAAGILRRDRPPLAGHPRQRARVWTEPVARQLDELVAIGELYRFDRFAAPASLWNDLQRRYPELLITG
jgi:RNA polymerase sigma factor (sigma-70 family)